MPPTKRQKTGEDSSASTKLQEAETSTPHKKDTKIRDTHTIPPHEYICMHRPHFDYEIQDRTLGEDALEDKLDDKYEKDFNEENKKGVILEPAKEQLEWEWIIMWEGFRTFSDYRRRSNYCDPDSFAMHINNDFNGYGLQDLMENMIVAFNATLKKKDDDSNRSMWAVISGLGLWLNEVKMGAFVNNEDDAKVSSLCGLMGSALMRALAALNHADEIKPDTTFLDVPNVIASFLYWSSDLVDFGIEGDATAWRPHAAAYFKKGNFDESKGITDTAKLLEKVQASDDNKLVTKDDKDPWGWAKRLKGYKSDYGPKIGGTKYDITKMSRKERASHAFDGKDPLKDIPEKDLKDGNLVLG